MGRNSVPDDVSVENATITLGLLKAIQKNESLTQRSVADELGVALGLVNAYLKRCVRKGYVKITQAPRNRYMYYLTPHGFAEKSRLTAEYLSQGFKFFGIARREIDEIYAECERRGWTRIVVYGLTDLAEIAVLCANDANVKLVAIVHAEPSRTEYMNLPIVSSIENFEDVDAVLLCDTRQPQETYELVIQSVPEARVFTPPLLNISRRPAV